MGNTTYAISDPHEPRESHGAHSISLWYSAEYRQLFLPIYAVKSESVIHAFGFLQKHTMSLIDFTVACSLGTGLIKSLERPFPLDSYCLPHHALPLGPDRHRSLLVGCQDNVRCSHGESHDCSVWVVQPLCLVSRSHGVAGLLQQEVSCLSQLNKTCYIP